MKIPQILKIIINKVGRIVYWSPSVEKRMNFTHKELSGKRITNFISKKEFKKIQESIRSGKEKTNGILPVEIKINDNSGNVHYLEGLMNDLTEDKTIHGIILNLRDITEKKIAENVIRESEERFRQLAENINDVFFIISPDFKVLYYISPRLKDLWGINPEEVYKNPERLIQSYYPEDKESASNAISQLNISGTYDFEHRILKADGSIRWIRSRAFPVKDEKGRIYKIAGVYEDITDRKYWEDQVSKLSKAVQQSPVIIMITNTTGIVEYINPKFTQVTGYKYDEVIGTNQNFRNSAFMDKEQFSELQNTIASGKDWQGEFRYRRKHGDLFWVSASVSPIIDDHGKITHYLLIQEDITQRKIYEKQLIAAKETAEKSDRLKSEFLAQMSHEIRTPLNNILTYTSLLEEEIEGDLPKGLERTFYVISSSAQRLIRTIDLILNLAKIQTGNFEYESERIDLDDDVLFDIILEFNNRAKDKNIELVYECKAENKFITGDPNTVGQIFVNLIDNAIKYSKDGEVRVTLHNTDGKVCVDVKDTGIGISKTFLPKLFEPFTQEDSSSTRIYEGTGLGLTLVKNYVEINKAEIEVESKKGKGTTFTVKFNKTD